MFLLWSVSLSHWVRIERLDLNWRPWCWGRGGSQSWPTSRPSNLTWREWANHQVVCTCSTKSSTRVRELSVPGVRVEGWRLGPVGKEMVGMPSLFLRVWGGEGRSREIFRMGQEKLEVCEGCEKCAWAYPKPGCDVFSNPKFLWFRTVALAITKVLFCPCT